MKCRYCNTTATTSTSCRCGRIQKSDWSGFEQTIAMQQIHQLINAATESSAVPSQIDSDPGDCSGGSDFGGGESGGGGGSGDW